MPPTVVDINEYKRLCLSLPSTETQPEPDQPEAGASDFSSDAAPVVLRPLTRPEIARGISSAYFLVNEDCKPDFWDPVQQDYWVRILKYLTYRYNDLTLTGTPFAPQRPFVSSQRPCENCDGTGCVPAGSWTATADRACDECRGHGYIGGEVDMHREKGVARR